MFNNSGCLTQWRTVFEVTEVAHVNNIWKLNWSVFWGGAGFLVFFQSFLCCLLAFPWWYKSFFFHLTMDQMELKTESKWPVDTAQTVILQMKKGRNHSSTQIPSFTLNVQISSVTLIHFFFKSNKSSKFKNDTILNTLAQVPFRITCGINKWYGTIVSKIYSPSFLGSYQLVYDMQLSILQPESHCPHTHICMHHHI